MLLLILSSFGNTPINSLPAFEVVYDKVDV